MGQRQTLLWPSGPIKVRNGRLVKTGRAGMHRLDITSFARHTQTLYYTDVYVYSEKGKNTPPAHLGYMHVNRGKEEEELLWDASKLVDDDGSWKVFL